MALYGWSNALKHVLIIEDEPMIALAIQMTLEDEGVSSFNIAATEADAVALADQHQPDFITSDVALLEGTGPRAFAVILARHGSIPVLFLTGNPEDCAPVTAPAVVLTKPFNARQIALTYHALTNGPFSKKGLFRSDAKSGFMRHCEDHPVA